jgi:osmotically-inducible protein OsmY
MATMVQTPVRSDSMIRESVISELKWDPKLTTSADVAVAVKEGVVTLSGFVHS